jgi:vitamin B12 transporter
MNHFVPVTAAALLSVPVALSAAEIPPRDTLVVTATRTETPLTDATVPVTVISRDDIELSLAKDLAELLRFEAGIDIGRNGGPGQTTSLFLRGTESNHTLVLVDGVRINPGTIGGAAIQNISPGIIERVEIVKGARSALFGTDAIGGVINIITRRAEDGHVEAGLGAGSFASRSGHIAVGDRGSSGEFGVNLNWQSTDGYAPRVDSDLERGYENRSTNLYAARKVASSEISIRHWQSDGNTEYLDFFLNPVDQDYRNTVTAIGLDTSLAEDGTSKLLVSLMEDEVRQRQTPDFVRSERWSFDWQYSHTFEHHKLTGGLFAVTEDASSISFGSLFDASTELHAIFLQDQLTFDRHKGFAAVRLSDHETFGRHTTWNVEYAFKINDVWTASAGLGHAFRAPDATDRFGFGGNPDLRPELADEMQLGLRYAPDGAHGFDVEVYTNDIEDLIEFDLQSYSLQNISQAKIRGTQFGYEYRGEHTLWRADVVRQRADDAITNDRLLRRAETSATISFTRLIGPHRLGLSVLASGDRVDFGAVRLPGYMLANLTGQVQLNNGWRISVRVENLFDTEYMTAAEYRMQARSSFLELQYRWQ